MTTRKPMTREFDCTECGQHIVAIVSVYDDDICAMCMTVPGWFRNPELLAILAPEGLDNLPEHEKDKP